MGIEFDAQDLELLRAETQVAPAAREDRVQLAVFDVERGENRGVDAAVDGQPRGAGRVQQDAAELVTSTMKSWLLARSTSK